MKYGYARVSTIAQDLTVQIEELKKDVRSSLKRSSLERKRTDLSSRSCLLNCKKAILWS
jgi:DNA invertase Pin-like site-specific DNA recombinase